MFIDSSPSTDESFDTRTREDDRFTKEEDYSNSDKLMSPTNLNEASITASTPQRKLQESSIMRRDEDPNEIRSFKSSSDSSDDETNHGNNELASGNDDNEWKKDTMPQIGKSLTPWRQEHRVSFRRTDPQYDRSRGSPQTFRDPAIKPLLNSVPFETRPVNFKALITPNELDSLRNLLKKYKIKIAALEEVIKNINQSDGGIEEETKLFYEKLLNDIKDNIMDDENEVKMKGLINENITVKANLTKTQEELNDLRKEYTETLSIADEHLKDFEEMNSILNNMLEDLIVAMRQNLNADKFKDVIPILENTLNQESNYVLTKLQHFQNCWIEVIQSPEFQQRNILPIDGPSEDSLERDEIDENDETKDTIENTSIIPQLSPQAEAIIENLHKEYDAYMLEVKNKLGKLLSLRNILMKKLEEQDNIMRQLSLAIVRKRNIELDDSRDLESINTSISQLSFKFQNELALTKTEFIEQIRNMTASNLNVIKTSMKQYKDTEREHLRLIGQLTNERDSLIDKLGSLKDEVYQLQQQHVRLNDTRDRNFVNLKQSVVFSLTNIISILKPVLEKDSVAKILNKIAFIKDPENGLEMSEHVQMKVDSLLRFNEKALTYLLNEYTSSVINRPLSPLILSSAKSPLSPTETERDSIRIKELERLLSSEREARDIESKVTEQRINKLELENQLLREQLQESTQK